MFLACGYLWLKYAFARAMRRMKLPNHDLRGF
jgi:hypothetical protein